MFNFFKKRPEPKPDPKGLLKEALDEAINGLMEHIEEAKSLGYTVNLNVDKDGNLAVTVTEKIFTAKVSTK